MNDLSTSALFGVSMICLFLATQIVILVLNQLEKKKFSAVLLGTMITPMCTGFPNLVIGVLGQERFQGDLVLQLNMGNNLANTSLVAGLLIFLAGPLSVQPLKGTSLKARKALRDQGLAFFFLWLGTLVCAFLAADGTLSRLDGLALVLIYFCYQLLAFRRRGKVSKKLSLTPGFTLLVLLALGISTWLIQFSLKNLGMVMDRVDSLFPGRQLGLFLGLLTVIPESFLMLRLAFKQGSLGLNGLVGDCLVSIPLVVGISSLIRPIPTQLVNSISEKALLPFAYLGVSMAALTMLSFSKKPVPRKVGIFFILLYAMVWFLTS